MTAPAVPPTAPTVHGARFAGAVLVGGASTRMGTDKATLVVDGAPMAARVAAALLGAGAAEVVAIGGEPAASSRHGLAVVPDRWPGEGPLGGVVTALGWYASHRSGVEAVVVTACDLPWLDAATVRSLIDAWHDAPPGTEVVVARTERREPLCAVWSTSLAGRLEQCLATGERAVHRAQSTATVLEVRVDEAAVRNVNRPADLDRGSDSAPDGAPDRAGGRAGKVPRHADS